MKKVDWQNDIDLMKKCLIFDFLLKKFKERTRNNNLNMIKLMSFDNSQDYVKSEKNVIKLKLTIKFRIWEVIFDSHEWFWWRLLNSP